MKLIRRMLLCMLLAMVACVCVGCSVYREPVALLPGIEFGMNPSEAQAVLGEPDGAEKFTGMNDVTYTWLTWENRTVAGHPATIRLKFAPFRRGMIMLQYIVTFAGEDKPALMTELDAALTAQLTGDRGFTRRDYTDSVSYDCNRGPVGTDYLLSVWEGSVRLLGQCNEYDR